MKIIYALLLSCTILCATANNQMALCEEQSTTSREPLRGSISHSEHLPPLDAELRVGAKFDMSVLHKEPANNFWYRIPNWAGGHWKQKTCTTFYRKNLNSGTDDYSTITYAFRQNSSLGMQQDRAGNIWQLQCPGSNLADTDDEFIVELIDDMQPRAISETSMTICYIGTNLHVQKRDHRIREAHRVECITTSTLAGQNTMKDVASVEGFDENGQPLDLAKILCFCVRQRQFVPLDSYRGQNLKSMFRQFLNSHSMSELAP
jgi:hypothetical protein